MFCEWYAYQVCDGNQNIVENTYGKYETALYDGWGIKWLTLSKESLNQATVWAAITPADVERLPDGHKSYDGIEKERCNLRRESESFFALSLSNLRYTYEKACSSVTHNVSDQNEVNLVASSSPSKWAECGFDIGKHGPLSCG